MIYDNGASQKGKGLHFHYKRLKEHLRWHCRRYGRTGAMFLMDFHHFFPEAPHALIYERHRELILDPNLRALADLVVAAVPGGVGMPLGVEPSQQEMVALPSFCLLYTSHHRDHDQLPTFPLMVMVFVSPTSQ